MTEAASTFGRTLLRLPPRIIFGCGTLSDAPAEARRIGQCALLCTDANISHLPALQRLVEGLSQAGVATHVFDRCPAEVPVGSISDCLEVVRGVPIDVVIGIGGGSSIDMAKVCALAVTHGARLDQFYGEDRVPGPVLPVIAIPATAGTGSEVTPVAVVSEPDKHLKVGISSTHLVPTTAICDPELTVSCPPLVTGYSGIDALIHAIEAYLAPPRSLDSTVTDVFRGRSAFTAGFALPAIELIAGSLERAFVDGDDIAAREKMLFGSLSAGMAFGHAGTSGAHALQYPVGSATRTPHGLGVGVLAPYVLEFVKPAALSELGDIALALGLDVGGLSPGEAAAEAIAEVERLAAAVGIPHSLAELGVLQVDLPGLAVEASMIGRLLRNSPRTLDQAALEAILDAAWKGDRTELGA